MPINPAQRLRVIATLVGIVLLAVLAFAIPSCLQKYHSRGAQGRVDAGQASAASKSAKDAIGTVRASGARETQSEELTRQNEKEIRHADGANDPVNPGLRDAGVRALCLRDAYRHDPRCQLQQPASR